MFLFNLTNKPLTLALAVFVSILVIGLSIFISQFSYIGGVLTSHIIIRAILIYGIAAISASIFVYFVSVSFNRAKNRNKR